MARINWLVIVIITLCLAACDEGSKKDPAGDGPSGSETPVSHQELPKFKHEADLWLMKATGDTVMAMEIELAEEGNEITQGLMHRSSMQENRGMLFLFPDNRMRSFWMKNTMIGLDILFISPDGTINTIQRNTKPYRKDPVPSDFPAQFVLELNAGFCDRHDITRGDKISFERISE